MQDKKWWLVFALSLISLGANFWGFPIYILDEAKNSACAMEMMQRGDWVVPTFNGVLRTDKPPLHYFFMISAFEMFGISSFSVRFFSVVMGMLTVALVFFSVKSMIGARAAAFASMILVSSLYFVIQFHLAVPDPYLIFFLTASWLSFIYAHQSGKANFYYLFYVGMALAFMTKGPLAIVLTLITIVGFMIIQKDFSVASIHRLRWKVGIIIFLAVTLPWWLAVTVATEGAWPKGFLLTHNLERFTSTMEGHDGFPGYAILLLFISLFPISLYLPGAARKAWSERKTDSLSFFSLIALSSVLFFFSFSRTMLPNYVGPAVPFGAIVLGSFIDRKIDDALRTSWTVKIGAVIGLIVAVAIPLALNDIIAKDVWLSDLSELRWMLLPITAGSALSVYFVYNNQWKNSILSYLISFWVVSVLTFYWAAPAILSKNPVTESLPLIHRSNREVVGYGNFNPAYVFSLQRPIPTFTSIDELRGYVKDKPVTLISRSEYKTQLMAAGFRPIFEKPYLFEYPVVLVMTYSPEK